MHQASLPFTISLLAAAALMVLLAVYGWRYRRTAFGPAYIGLMFCASLYAGGYALELASSTLAQMLVWNKVQYLGISFIPFFWILMTARYSGRDAWLSRVVVAALFSLSFFTLLFDVTNAYLHIFYKSVGVDASGPFPIIQLMKGPWYWVHIAYYVITLLAGALLLVDSFRRAAPGYRRQTAVILTAALLPGAGLFVYLAGLSPYNLDTTPMTLTVVAPVFAWGLFRYKIFELAPVAKERSLRGHAATRWSFSTTKIGSSISIRPRLAF